MESLQKIITSKKSYIVSSLKTQLYTLLKFWWDKLICLPSCKTTQYSSQLFIVSGPVKRSPARRSYSWSIIEKLWLIRQYFCSRIILYVLDTSQCIHRLHTKYLTKMFVNNRRKKLYKLCFVTHKMRIDKHIVHRDIFSQLYWLTWFIIDKYMSSIRLKTRLTDVLIIERIIIKRRTNNLHVKQSCYQHKKQKPKKKQQVEFSCNTYMLQKRIFFRQSGNVSFQPGIWRMLGYHNRTSISNNNRGRYPLVFCNQKNME